MKGCLIFQNELIEYIVVIAIYHDIVKFDIVASLMAMLCILYLTVPA